MWGSPYGPRMLAMKGVTTCLDMAGPLDDILNNVPEYGAGINMAILQFASPPFTFKAAGTDVDGSFNVNPPIPRIMLAEVKRDDGSFVVDAISTDGGCIPRNVILSQGLSLVKLDVLTLTEFAQKTSLNPARMLRLKIRDTSRSAQTPI